MDNFTEIKEKLNILYKEYKNKKNDLNDDEKKKVVSLLVEMINNPNSNTMAIAEQLSRFSYKICGIYFDRLTKNIKPSISVIDDLIKDFLTTVNDSKQPQHFVKKFANTIVPIINNYRDEAFNSKELPLLVDFIADYALNSNQSKKEFENIISRTNGKIYLLDYSDISKKSLNNIWKITSDIFPDLSKAKYESFITEWAEKYGFITSARPEEPTSTDNNVKIKESVVAKKPPKEEVPVAIQPSDKTESINSTSKKEEPKAHNANTVVSEKEEKSTTVPDSTKADASVKKPIAVAESKKVDTPVEKPVVSINEKNSNNTSEVDSSKKAPAQKDSVEILYERLKRDMDNERKAIISAFADKITSVSKEFESIQGEISKSREFGIENTFLKTKNEELKRQIAEMKTKLQENTQLLSSAKAENSDLKQQVASLESKNAELDSKLDEAYSINSRESSLEAEKVRAELKKEFSFLYEDWLEYEFSDASEENYESLQAIIKKIFRALKRSGIDYKGNN